MHYLLRGMVKLQAKPYKVCPETGDGTVAAVLSMVIISSIHVKAAIPVFKDAPNRASRSRFGYNKRARGVLFVGFQNIDNA
jgi:hypothetical protein